MSTVSFEPDDTPTPQTIVKDGFSNIESIVYPDGRDGRLIVDVTFSRGLTTEEKHDLMNALHTSAQKIVEEKN